MTFKSLLTVGLIISLSGCVTSQTAILTPQQVFVAANTFDAMETSAKNYLRLPLCPTVTVCRTQVVSVSLTNSVRVARRARNQLEAFINANPGSTIPVNLYQTVATAVSALQNLMIQNHIN
jgi:hypothetical protein